MKKYVFFTADIYPIGGIQIYVSGKAKYLEENGWKVYAFFNGFNEGECAFPKLNDYRSGKIPCLFFLPNMLSDKRVSNALEAMKRRIEYSPEDTIYIESHYDLPAFWAELFAQEVNGTHVCLCCNETFRGRRKYYERHIDFFKFKYDRNELAGISNISMKKLFDGKSYDIPESESRVFVAAGDDRVQDVENVVVDRIKRLDVNVCFIGRAKKGSLQPTTESIKRFCEQYPNLSCQYIVVSDVDEEDRKWISLALEKNENVVVTFTGALSPIPRSLFNKVDIVVASAGCAELSADEGVPTIVVDVENYMSNGLLGYDTKDSLYREKDGLCEPIEKTIEACLVQKKYKNKTFKLEKSVPNSVCYETHFHYFENLENVYYLPDKLTAPKRNLLMSTLFLSYLEKSSNYFLIKKLKKLLYSRNM